MLLIGKHQLVWVVTMCLRLAPSVPCCNMFWSRLCRLLHRRSGQTSRSSVCRRKTERTSTTCLILSGRASRCTSWATTRISCRSPSPARRPSGRGTFCRVVERCVQTANSRLWTAYELFHLDINTAPPLLTFQREVSANTEVLKINSSAGNNKFFLKIGTIPAKRSLEQRPISAYS